MRNRAAEVRASAGVFGARPNTIQVNEQQTIPVGYAEYMPGSFTVNGFFVCHGLFAVGQI